MVLTLIRRLVEVLTEQLEVPVHYGYPRTSDSSVMVIVGNADGQVSRERFRSGRAGGDEVWQISVEVVSEHHHTDTLAAAAAIDAQAQQILSLIADHPQLDVGSRQSVPGLYWLVADGYQLGTADEADGVIASGSLTFSAQTRSGGG